MTAQPAAAAQATATAQTSATAEPTAAAPGRLPQPAEVVIGFDDSAPSRSALLAAAEAATHRRAPLRLLTICLPEPGDGADLLETRQRGAADRHSRARLDRALHWVRSRNPGLTITASSVAAASADELAPLVEQISGCQLLVLGSHGRNGLRAFALGSVSRELARAAGCPMLIVPSTTTARLNAGSLPVVVGVDDGPLGQQALAQAATEARLRRTELCIVHCYRDNGAREVQLSGLALTDQVSLVLSAQPPGRALVAHGRAAQLLVVGSRGSLALAGLALGSVSRAVLDAMPCPVLVITG